MFTQPSSVESRYRFWHDLQLNHNTPEVFTLREQLKTPHGDFISRPHS